MALDLFKFLRGNSKRKEKKNYDPSNPLSSTKFLGGMKNTSVKTKPEPKMFPIPTDRKRPDYAIALDVATEKEYEDYALDVGKNAATPIPSDAEIVGKGRSATRRIGTDDPEMGYEGTIKPLGGLQKPKPQPTDKEQIKVFRERLQGIRNKRKSAAQARYDKQMAARNKRSSLFKTRTPEERQAAYDTAFSRPLGQNTMLGRASANREQRQIDMQKLNVQRKKEREAKKANRENS